MVKSTQQPNRQDYEHALKSMDTYMDITPEDVMRLAQRAEYYADQRVIESLAISKIMSSPVTTVREDTLMADAAHLMVSERISGLPVTDHADRLVGVITEADFLGALGIPIHHPHHSLWQTLETMAAHLSHHAELSSPNDSVAEHMTREVICAAPDSDIHHIVDLMKKHKVKRILICEQQKKVLGIVTRSNLVRLFFDKYSS